ncbi:hypothetical protein SCLCIDRAFT_162500 [Scleroderma citrinum Foug A]|uniref:Transmembrane protein n=1 Tax=Scleroderma citrinum Foug A TaxID=1036808 RepID=A0A0C3ESA0_9AGAM|nr:hypothetical protein SCLCIDRAFT_162500 [Scleroderma citrinum Foug A]
MSASLPPVFLPTPTSMTFETAPPATSTPSSSGSGSQNGSNYFFGFIATFIVLLLIFVSCGIGSRRRSRFVSSAWGRTFEGNEFDEALYGGLPASEWLRLLRTPPTFREAWLRPAQDVQYEAPWKDLQPISATFVRSLLPASTSKASPTLLQSQQEVTLPRSPMPPRPRPRLSIWNRLSTWLERRLTHQLPEPPPQPKYSSPEAVQVAVMVSMPSPFTSQCYAEGKGEGPSTLICPPLGDSISGGGD